jgi:hypothetical protein
MMMRRGLYFAKVIGTNVLPNEPVPPVMRIEEFSSMLVNKVLKNAVKVPTVYLVSSERFSIALLSFLLLVKLTYIGIKM